LTRYRNPEMSFKRKTEGNVHFGNANHRRRDYTWSTGMATEPRLLYESEERTGSTQALLPVPAIVPAVTRAPAARPSAARIKALRNRVGAALNRVGLKHTEFTVISNDCWGQALYQEWGLPCQTPFAGSGMHADCFLRFLEDIPGFLRSPLRFVSLSRHATVNRLRLRREPWPIAVLGDEVEVHFMHHPNQSEAARSWHQGCELVNLARLAVKFTVDKDGASPRHVARFSRMPFERKLLISERSHPEIDCAVQVPNYVTNGAMMFHRSLRHFDCAHWLNTGEIRRNTPRVLLNKLLYMRGA
jgi:uncharacterized protein (DUF1919 family)